MTVIGVCIRNRFGFVLAHRFPESTGGWGEPQQQTVTSFMPKKIGSKTAREKVFLSEAERHHCRWILNRQGYGVFSICGLHVRQNSSFCKVHHDLVWGNRQAVSDQQRAKNVHAA